MAKLKAAPSNERDDMIDSIRLDDRHQPTGEVNLAESPNQHGGPSTQENEAVLMTDRDKGKGSGSSS